MGVTIFRPGQRLVIPGVQVFQPRPSAGGAFTGILDGISNVAAAYSLRQLRSAYSGSAVRVRRSSDSTEQDIGFVAGEFDSAAFSSFVGGGTGYVRTWYDQSGNARDVGNSDGSKQPSISLSVTNSKPALYFPSAHGIFTASMPHFPAKRGGFIAVSQKTTTGSSVLAGTYNGAAPNFLFYLTTTGTKIKWYDGAFSNETNYDIQNATEVQSFSRYGDTAAKFWRGGALDGTFAHTNNQMADNPLHLGSDNIYSTSLIGYVFEFIYLSAAISTADHNTIGNDMATRFGLSWTTVT